MIIQLIDFNKLEIQTEKNLVAENIFIKNFKILSFCKENNKYTITLDNDIELSLLPEIEIFDQKFNICLQEIFNSDNFDKKYYTDEKLGAIYTKEKTTFRVWSPLARAINLILVDDDKKIAMHKKNKGIFEIEVEKDLLNQKYLYEAILQDKINISTDPYARSSSANEKHSVVVDILENNTDYVSNIDSIIYEASVRDLTYYKDSDIQNKAKFLGLCEKNRKTSFNQSVGLDYVKSLGITHIQLLPVFDFSSNSVDELNQFDKYNWGYDPVNYNVVEGSYSTNPNDPMCRVLELQKLIRTYHNENIGVIMDVVYNHVFDAQKHSFDLLVPNYYYRFKENGEYLSGTACGNDVASERSMVRKYIVDSVVFWQNKYKFDGFRFDLMGILDIKTMNEIYERLSSENKNVIVLGEGWDLNSLDASYRANQKNADKMPKISFFNDNIRDGVKGSTFENIGCGFVSKKPFFEKKVIDNILYPFKYYPYVFPKQLIQYVEAHDNLTLYDQLKITLKDENEENILKRHLLATSIVLLSFGIPFIHSGQEFARTKNNDENSYKSSDSVNMIDYKRAYDNINMVSYIKNLIEIRKQLEIFNINSFEEIENISEVLCDTNFVIAYKIENKTSCIIIHNANDYRVSVNIPNGLYKVLVKDNLANYKGLENIKIENGKLEIEALSTMVLVK